MTVKVTYSDITWRRSCDGVHKARRILTIAFKMLPLAAFVLSPLGRVGAPSAQSSPWLVNAIYQEPVWGQSFRSIVGLAKDPVSGELYVLDAGRRTIDVLDSTGVVRFSFGHWFTDSKTGQRQLGEPNSLAVSEAGEIFMTDFYSSRVDVLNIRGEAIGEIDVLTALGWDQSTCRPEKVALDGSEWLYISIGGARSGVARCRQDGSDCALFVDAAVEKIDCITGVSASSDGRVAVTDYRGKPAVRIYDSGGQLLLGFGGHDTDPGDLSFPSAFLFAADGTFWVVDALRQVVKHYAANGEFKEYIGGFGVAPGNLRYPSAVSGNGVSQLYVAERVGRRVQEFILPTALAVPVPEPVSDTTRAGAVAATPEIENSRVNNQ
jgi:DNA-binding beta-propeller fold protein YncE